jgi:ubiquinone/menaquinone biosynthesis C-methylase UbiE
MFATFLDTFLAGFQARREWRVTHPEQALTRWGEKSKPHSKFMQFTGIGEGKMLDVGCGPGKLRYHFGNDVVYYGLDPIALPEVEGFPFVQALSESMPFKSRTFSHVAAIAALDHFKDLDAFFGEAIRVLKPNGRLHLVQSIHELRGPLSAVKMLGHWLKDTLEDRATKTKNPEAPKHITEFTTSFLHQTLTKHFVIEALDQYSFRWYSPTKLLVTLTPMQAG